MKRREAWLIFTSYSTLFMLGVYITVYQYTILDISVLYNLNITYMGILIGAQHFGMAVPPLILGALCGRIGKKRVILIAYVLLAAGTWLAGAATGLLAFTLSILAIGAGFCVAEATLSAVLADEFIDRSNSHLNFSQVAFSAGALTGPFLAAYLIDRGVYFKDLYYGCSIVFLVLGILFLFTKHNRDILQEMRTTPVLHSISSFFQDRRLMLLAMGILIYVGIENTIASFTDSYFVVALDATKLSATAIALFWGMMIPSRLLAGLTHRNKDKTFIVLSLLLVVFLVLAMIIPDSTVKIVFIALSGFACGPMWPYIMGKAASRKQGMSGPALNFMSSFSAVGGAVIPAVSGLLSRGSRLSVVFYFCAGLAVVLIWVMRNAGKGARKNS